MNITALALYFFLLGLLPGIYIGSSFKDHLLNDCKERSQALIDHYNTMYREVLKLQRIAKYENSTTKTSP